MNVLVTSAARKVWLVRAFQEAVRPLGGQVWASDLDPLAAALQVADGRVLLPRTDHPAFGEELRRACVERDIHLLVPSRDAELPVVAALREDLGAQGIVALVPSAGTVALCQDKRAFVEHCRAHGLRVPPDPGDPPEFPLFARPRVGSGSRGAGVILDEEALARLVPPEDWLVQRRVYAPELTLDLLADFEGNVLSVVPRRRLRVVDGESVVGATVDAPGVVEAAVGLARSLGLVAHNTLQCFLEGDGATWIEVNPRFGGGAALGFAAGVHTPTLLVALRRGERVAPRLGEYQRDLMMYRHSADLFVRGPG